MKIERFNQGFSKFGPMEMCSEGQWVKWKDVISFIVNLARMKDLEIARLRLKIERYEKMIIMEKHRQLQNKMKKNDV